MEYSIIKLFEDFLKENKRDKRGIRGGLKLAPGTKRNYLYLRRHLVNFGMKTGFPLRVRTLGRDKKQINRERKYYHELYQKFTDYLFDELKHYDNYVGHNIKMLKTFFAWLTRQKGMHIGEFYKDFYVWKEELPVIVLSIEQLRFLIQNEKFDKSLPIHLRRTKDLFVFGCTTALRVSDLMTLKNENVEHQNNATYIRITSKKTRKQSKIKLPNYAKLIIDRNKQRGKRLFPLICANQFNSNIKKMAERAGWIEPVNKIRSRRGLPLQQIRSNAALKQYRFCDLLITHTMRRTAITSMLELGMEENSVRKISGHAPGSVEFYKYVKYNQERLDDQSDLVFEKLTQNVEI